MAVVLYRSWGLNSYPVSDLSNISLEDNVLMNLAESKCFSLGYLLGATSVHSTSKSVYSS